jgi:hypothetical protein
MQRADYRTTDVEHPGSPTSTAAVATPEALTASRGIEAAVDAVPWSRVGPLRKMPASERLSLRGGHPYPMDRSAAAPTDR